ncbi:hypothetical protein CEUSTIGMA_g5646.t1 [Chlamydomonas eustigma]|uniref:Uncharacterized protein n=1 Tax=Chlamydomonas eustigma TaxID=1157962 RepID=A0A250X538_9CHLO|nr:hypothetical protein CEUSTIGMA_g5646.t1 [Chlamydomonas eustigma]|eukprot:GAX78204.1 hypothetical protein CEUSTIGMA_g5646.t1 [Chlamydomonas eustigma]
MLRTFLSPQPLKHPSPKSSLQPKPCTIHLNTPGIFCTVNAGKRELLASNPNFEVSHLPPKHKKQKLAPQNKVTVPSLETVKIYRKLYSEGSAGLLNYINSKKATYLSMASHLMTLYEFGVLELGKLLEICNLRDGSIQRAISAISNSMSPASSVKGINPTCLMQGVDSLTELKGRDSTVDAADAETFSEELRLQIEVVRKLLIRESAEQLLMAVKNLPGSLPGDDVAPVITTTTPDLVPADATLEEESVVRRQMSEMHAQALLAHLSEARSVLDRIIHSSSLAEIESLSSAIKGSLNINNLLALLDLGLIPEQTLIQLYNLQEDSDGSSSRLSFNAIVKIIMESSRSVKGVTSDAKKCEMYLQALSQKMPELLEEHEKLSPGLPQLQVQVTQAILQRRAAKSARGFKREKVPKTKSKPKDSEAKAEEPAVVLPLRDTMVLPTSHAITLNCITKMHLGDIREISVNRGILPETIFSHLLFLLDFEKLDVDTLLKLLRFGTPGCLTLQTVHRAVLDFPARSKSLSRKNHGAQILQKLSEIDSAAVQTQERRLEGLTLLQVELVLQLLKRGMLKDAIYDDLPASSSSSSSSIVVALEPADMDAHYQALTGRLLKKAGLKRVEAYLQGKTIPELQQPPYSNKRGVSEETVLESLLSAVKAGVELPLERLLADFQLDDAEGKWMRSSDIVEAIKANIHLRDQGFPCLFFYEAVRSQVQLGAGYKREFRYSTNSLMGHGLPMLQIRLVYYLLCAGLVPGMET